MHYLMIHKQLQCSELFLQVKVKNEESLSENFDVVFAGSFHALRYKCNTSF